MFFTPIIKPLDGVCNLSCKYCYFKNITEKQKTVSIMSDLILEKTIALFCNNQTHIEFIWHGGEPLLAKIAFYKKVIDIQKYFKSTGIKIKNSIQTNATLIDKDWAMFFKENNFSVGVSIDGPKNLHDKFRYYENHSGSYENTIKGIKLLQEFGVDFGIICCINSNSINEYDSIFNFFIENKITNIKFSRVRSFDGDSSYAISQKEYTKFLLTIFQKWIDMDNDNIKIRDIESIVNTILGGNQRECIFASKCHKYLTIYSNGDIYPCDSISKNTKYFFGNVLKNNSADILKNTNFINLKKELYKKQIYCKNCRYRKICRGGCFLDWQRDENGCKNISCEDLKYMFANFYSILDQYNLL